MAMIEPNKLIGTLKGKIGNLVLVPREDGHVIVREAPERKAGPTEGELANQSRFARAAAYVKSVRRQPDLYAPYQLAAKLKGKRACDLAHGDFRHSPVVADIDPSSYSGKAGEPIWIQAVDDFEVVRVSVCVRDADGTVLERGAAALSSGKNPKWLYVATADIPPGRTVVIEVAAVDRPGNIASKSIDHLCRSRQA